MITSTESHDLADQRREILLGLATLVNERRSIAEIFDAFADRLTDAARFDYCSLMVLDDDRQSVRVVGARPLFEGHVAVGSRHPTQFAAVQEVSAFPEGTDYNPAAFPQIASLREMVRQGMHRGWTTPLLSDGVSYGAFAVMRRAKGPFPVEDLEFLREASRLLAGAVRQDDELGRMRREATRSSLLAQLAVMLNAGGTIDALFNAVAPVLDDALGCDYINLLVVGSVPGVLEMVGRRPLILHEAPVRYTFEEANIAGLMRIGGPVQFSPDPSRGGGGGWMARAGIRSAVTTLLRRDDEPLGMFSVGRIDRDAPFSDDDLRFVEHVAALASQAVANQFRLAQAAAEAARSKLLGELAVLVNAGEPFDSLVDRMLSLIGRAVQFDWIQLSAARTAAGRFTVEFSRPPLFEEGARGPISAEQIEAIRAGGRTCTQYRPTRLPPGPGIDVLIDAGIERGCDALLMNDGAVLGSLVLGRKRDIPFTADEMAFLEVVATLLAQAITQEQRLSRARSDAARAQLLNELALLVNAGEPVESLADRMLSLIGQAVAFDWIQMSTAPKAGEQFIVRLSRPELFTIGKPSSTSPEQIEAIRAMGRACAQYRPTKTHPGPGLDVLIDAGIERACDVLFMNDTGVLGNLVLGRSRNVGFTDDELGFLEVVATLLTQAISEENRLASVRADAARSSVLNELGLLLNAGEPVGSLVDRLGPLVEQAVSFDYIGLAASRSEEAPFIFMLASPPIFPVGEQAVLSAEQIDVLRKRERTHIQYGPADMARDASLDAIVAAGYQRACGAFLSHPDGVLGCLVLARREDRRFTPEETGFLEVVATLLSQAIAQEQRLASTQAEAAKSHLLNDLALLLSSGGAVGSISEQMLGTIERAVPYDLFSLLTREDPSQPFQVVLSKNGIRSVGDLSTVTDDFIATRRLTGRDVWQYSTVEAGEGPVKDRFLALGISRVCDILLVDQGEVLGMMALGRKADFAFSDGEITFLEVVTALLAQALANEQRVRGAVREANEQRLLAEVTSAVAQSRTPAVLARAVAETLGRFLPRASCVLGLLRDGNVSYLRPGRPPLVWALAEHNAASLAGEQVWGDSPAAARTAKGAGILKEEQVRAWALTPCTAGGEISGFLLATAADPDYSFDDRTRGMLRILAQIIGPAIANSQAAADTARERSLYNLALNSLSEAVILLDGDFRTVFANAHGEKLGNLLDPARALGTLDEQAASVPRQPINALASAVAEGKAANGRVQVAVDGTPTWYDFEVTPLDHPLYRLLCVATDVTAEVDTEAERAQHREEIEKASRLAALGELVGGVAHELNNPLTAIVGFSELLAASGRLGPSSEELDIIQTEAMRARDIVRDLLFVARPAPVELVEVDVAAVMDHVARLRRAGWSQKGIDVAVHAEGVTRTIRGNAHQLIQLVLNLVTNAEHALEGQPAPRIEIAAHETAEGIVLTVADNGHGMDRATLDRVFEPFFTTKHSSGTGLGLSVSYSIVASHNGRIDVESELRKGTRFRIVLPFGGEDSAVLDSVSETATAVALRVLVIDDEPNLRKLCQRLITRLGHECDVAEDSVSACDLLQAQSYDLIFCDYRLRSETARTVVERISEVDPALVDRIIIATGATTDPGVVELTGGRGLKLIAKPYGLDEIRDILSEAAERR